MDTTTDIPAEFQDASEALTARGWTPVGTLGRGGTSVVFAVHGEAGDHAVKVAWAWPSDVHADGKLLGATQQRLRIPKIEASVRSVRCVLPWEQFLCNRLVSAEYGRLLEVDDPAVVRPTEAFSLGTRSAFVMPIVQGPAMELKPGPRLVALASTLQRLHDNNWVHGDLKPENIRCTGTSSVCLIDPLAIGSDLHTPEWSHLNFLVATPLVDSADPRDRRAVFRHRDHVSLALMALEAFLGDRPWGHPEVTFMVDRGVSMDAKRAQLTTARDKLSKLTPKLPEVLRPFVSMALDPGLWPEEGPTFAAYLQARPFETRADALASLDIGDIFARACG